MKTVVHTDDHLVIEDRPALMAGTVWLMGLAALMAAGSGQIEGATTLLVTALGVGVCGVAWHFFPYQRFTFDRAAGTFHRRVARITGAATQTLALDDIERAALQAQWNDGARMERVALLTGAGPMPLELGFVSTPRKPVVDEINRWLGNSPG